MVTAARFRAIALSLEGALEVPHMERAAFRTKRRIFATLPPDGASANLLFDLDLQEAICEALPHAFAPIPGGWGRMGYTTVNLRTVSDADLVRALREAHSRACDPPKRAAAKKKTAKKKTAATSAPAKKKTAKKKTAKKKTARPASERG